MARVFLSVCYRFPRTLSTFENVCEIYDYVATDFFFITFPRKREREKEREKMKKSNNRCGVEVLSCYANFLDNRYCAQTCNKKSVDTK